MRITDRAVADLSLAEGRSDLVVADDAEPGFRVRVLASGKKLFLFRYKVGGVSRRVPLGAFGTVTAAAARKQAERLRGEVRAGRDPWAERRDGRADALKAEAEARKKAEADAFTVRRLLDDWDRLRLATRRTSYRRDALSRLNLHLAAIMDKPAGGLTRAEAARAVDRAAEKGGATTSRRVKQYASTMFRWAIGRGAVASNPFLLPRPYGPFAAALLLTLARRQEVAAMAWGELAPDLSAWTLPAGRSKNRKAHVAHLADPTRAVLAGNRRGEPDELVFATLDGAPLTSFSWIKRELDKAIDAERAEAGLPPVLRWTFHDFRRSGVTWLAENGTPPHVADKLLNHVAGTIRGVAAIYQRGEFAEERRRALDAWAAYVLHHGLGA